MDKAHEAYKNGMRKLLKTGEHSDVLLRCSDGTTFHCHKGILCAQSDFFAKALQPGTFKEGHLSEVNLVFGDSSVITKVLEYIYTQEFSHNVQVDVAHDIDRIMLYVKVWILADFYVIHSLKEIALERLKNKLNGGRMKSYSVANVEQVVKITKVIYENSPNKNEISTSNLRSLWVDFVVRHVQESDDQNINPNFLEIIGRNPEFATDFAMMQHIKWFQEKRIKSRKGGGSIKQLPMLGTYRSMLRARARSIPRYKKQ